MWEGKRFIRGPDVAVLLGVTVSQLQEWRNRGVGPPYYQYNQRVIAYDENEVKAWAEEQHRLAVVQTKLKTRPNGEVRLRTVREVEAEAYFNSQRRPSDVVQPTAGGTTTKKKKRPVV